MKKVFLLILTALVAVSSYSQMKNADLIVYNARIYTVNDNFDIKEAFAVKDGKFIAVGNNNEILENYSSENKVDAMEKPVYPGFIDAHCHFYGYGITLVTKADLVGTVSFEDVINRLKDYYSKYPSEWLQGRGWDQNDWKNKEFPDNKLLDKAFPDVPVFITRIDGHAAIANTKALRLAGVTKATKVDGGKLIIKNGKLTGVLIDNAMEPVSSIIPAPSEQTEIKAIVEAQQNCFNAGLTSVVDAVLEAGTVNLIDSLQNEGILKMRINAMLSPTEENFSKFVNNGVIQKDRLTVRSIKLYADGALGSRGAKLLKPYSDDPGNTGLLIHNPDYYREVCKMAYKKGYQVNTHAIGDSANRMMLTIYGEFLKGKNDKRWRIEHSQVVNENDFDLFGKFSIVPSVQPTHATSDMYWAEDRLGPERIKGAYAYKELLKENGWLPLGTDFPIENINPLYTFYAAVARKDLKGYPEGGWQPENALSREEALKGMSIWAAKGSFEDDVKGSIEPGKFADFVILGKDIMNIETDRIQDIKVSSTWVNGEKVSENH
jgi:predicted amidohydrolase YtcJ